MDTMNRRNFLKTSLCAGASLSLAGRLIGAEPVKSSSPTARKLGWTLCCQLYTFRSMSFYEALEKIAALGFECVEPAFFLSLSKEKPDLKTNEQLPAEARKELKKRLEDFGIKMTNFYGDLKNDKDNELAVSDPLVLKKERRNRFEFRARGNTIAWLISCTSR